MSLNYKLPNGVTMGFNDEAERDAYLSSAAGAGAVTQESAQAASPDKSMEQIKNDSYTQHYSAGGGGYGMLPTPGQDRDWGANVDKNKWIVDEAEKRTGWKYGGNFGGQYTNNFGTEAAKRGVDVGELESAWAASQATPASTTPPADNTADTVTAGTEVGATGADRDWGTNASKNKWLVDYVQKKYGKTFDGSFGGKYANNFTAWAQENGIDVAELESTYNAIGIGDVDQQANSVEARLARILDPDSAIMQRAATSGLQIANSRGLLNSSMAVDAAQGAMIDRALPIASQDSTQGTQTYMQDLEIQNQKWLANLDADTRKTITTMQENNQLAIANLQVGQEDKRSITGMVATVTQNYGNSFNTIANNENIPKETRDAYLVHINTVAENQIAMIESIYGVDLTWAATGT